MKSIVLDTGPLSIVTQRAGHSVEVDECQAWFAHLEKSGAAIYVPEISDYELRRELVRLGKSASIARLDAFIARVLYIPITTIAMRKAAELWAQARNRGLPTASSEALDADAILAAQALILGLSEIVVASSNTGHLSRFVRAEEWRAIQP